MTAALFPGGRSQQLQQSSPAAASPQERENRRAHLFQDTSAFHRGTVARSLTQFKCARIVSQRTSKVQGPQLAQLGPTLLSLLLGLLWGPTCWDWGCNEGAATPRWGCICRPKTVRHWLNEWGPGCHCNAQGQLPLHSASDVEAAQLCAPRDEERRRRRSTPRSGSFFPLRAPIWRLFSSAFAAHAPREGLRGHKMERRRSRSRAAAHKWRGYRQL